MFDRNTGEDPIGAEYQFKKGTVISD